MCAAETYTILIVFGYPYIYIDIADLSLVVSLYIYQGAGKRPAAQEKKK